MKLIKMRLPCLGLGSHYRLRWQIQRERNRAGRVLAQPAATGSGPRLRLISCRAVLADALKIQKRVPCVNHVRPDAERLFC